MREILAFAPVVCLIAYAVLTRQMAQAMVVAGVLETECSRLLEEFFRTLRETR